MKEESNGNKKEVKNKDRTDANDLVSPRNTEKLYGKKASQPDPESETLPETVETSLPEIFGSADQDVDQNMFPSS